jgi:uncharacterized protein involved in type VI secretion and phage assembly
MANGLIDTAAQAEAPAERRIYGVAVAQVINNVDTSGQGRVQVHLPWMPELEPWARVAVPMAGRGRGTFIIPQRDDEVLVIFNHGDVREPYVIGSLWNAQDRPPATNPQDAVNKRLIRTPQGHEIELDDAQQSIKITSSSGQKVTIDPSKIELETAENRAKLTLDKDESKVTIEATQSLLLKAQQITIEGETIRIKGNSNVQLQGGNLCDVQANTVRIN